MSEITHAYVGRKSCGCVTLVTVDDPEQPREAAKYVAQCVRRGEAVERILLANANDVIPHLYCDEHRSAPRPRKPMAERARQGALL